MATVGHQLYTGASIKHIYRELIILSTKLRFLQVMAYGVTEGTATGTDMSMVT